MNWFTKALTATVTAMRFGGQSKGPFGLGLLKRTKFDYRREIGDCLDSSVVTAPVQWVARALPEAELAMEKRDAAGKCTQIESHPLLDLIQTPNPFYGDIALWMATVFSFLIAGNAYWVIVRNSYGRPVELWYVPHWMMEPAWPTEGNVFISHYIYRPGGGMEPVNIAVEDVVHFRHGIDPRNIRLGISPLDGVIREIFIDLESSNFVASLLRNMGVPGVVISPKGGGVSSDDVEATNSWFRQAFGGDNRGRPLVMGAPTEVASFGFNPQQMNMSEGRDVAEERVCACIGIPAAVVGFGAGLQSTKVGATMEELRKLAWTNGVAPIGRMLADEIQRSLVPQFGDATGLTVEFDMSQVTAMQEDEDKKVKRLLGELTGGAITLAEYREQRGLPVDKSHEVFFRPINLIEVPASGVAPVAPTGGSKSALQSSQAGYQRALAFALALQKVGDRQAKAFEKPLMGLFAKFGRQAQDAALPLLEKDPTIGAPPKAAPDGEEKADDLLVEMILAKLGINEWDADLSLAYQGQYLEVDKAVAAEAERAGVGTSMPDVLARSIIAAGGRRAGLVDLGGQTKDALFKALAQGRAEGEGATALAARIAKLVEAGPTDTPEARARRIARTETKYAQNISTIERGKAAGVDKFVVFDGRLGPGRSTPSHIARNGSIVTGDEALTMAAEEHPNGTLSFAPNFEED